MRASLFRFLVIAVSLVGGVVAQDAGEATLEMPKLTVSPFEGKIDLFIGYEVRGAGKQAPTPGWRVSAGGCAESKSGDGVGNPTPL